MPSAGGPPPQCLETHDVGSEQMHSDKIQLNLSVGSFNSTIRFDNEREVSTEMKTATFSGSWRMDDRWSLRAGLGVILDGGLQPGEEATHEVNPGGLATIGVEYFALPGGGYSPFINLSLAISASMTKTTHPQTDDKTNYFASDLRLGALAGWNISNTLFPYLTTRLFGGPVSWKMDDGDVTGSDIHHYQLAMGAAIQFGQTGLFIEWAALGEQGLNAGLSIAL